MIRLIVLLQITLAFIQINGVHAQDLTEIKGKIYLDSSWDNEIFLSHISSFDDMYTASSNMIIASSRIDSLGSFYFGLNFLSEEPNLYRLHVIKKGDTRNTLILGGNSENHTFLFLKNKDKIEVLAKNEVPPFKSIFFKNSKSNSGLVYINSLFKKYNIQKEESSSSKSRILEDKLKEDLLNYADTTESLMVSLYAINKCNCQLNSSFYNAYLTKWEKSNNRYLNNFKEKFKNSNLISEQPKKQNNFTLVLIFVGSFSVLILLYFLFFRRKSKSSKLKKMSISERKIFEFILNRKTNKEIAEELNIEVSTVKSHCSNIYSKLKVNSRKELIDKFS